jgi:hypothetical protein
MRRVVTLLALSIASCAWSPTSAPTAGAAVRKPALDQVRHRLAELFHGTPVVLVTDRDGSLRAEVPLRLVQHGDPGESHCARVAGKRAVKEWLIAFIDLGRSMSGTRRSRIS